VIRELRGKSELKNDKRGDGGNDVSGASTLNQLYPAGLQELMPPRASGGGEAEMAKVTLDCIRVRVKTSNRIDDARRQITALLRERHRVGSGQADDFHIHSVVVWTDAASKQSR
jgi:hypothetical protein